MFEFSAIGEYRGRRSFEHVLPDAVMAFLVIVTASEVLELVLSRGSSRVSLEKGGQTLKSLGGDEWAGRWWFMTQCLVLVGLVVAAAGMKIYQTVLIWRDGGAPVYVDLACDAIHLHMPR